jgi:acyl carrier protein
MTGTEAELRENILKALTDVAPDLLGTEIKDEDPIRESYDLDSADYLHFIVRIHELLGVDIPEKDYPKVNTVSSAMKYLVGQRKKSSRSRRGN